MINMASCPLSVTFLITGGGHGRAKNDTCTRLAHYAEHCLNMMAETTDEESRRIQREMAAECENWRMQFADHVSPNKCEWNDAGR